MRNLGKSILAVEKGALAIGTIPDIRKAVFTKGLSVIAMAPVFFPFAAELQPWFSHIPTAWKAGQYYTLAWGFKWSCGRGVPIFAKLFVDGVKWDEMRDETPFDSGIWYFGWCRGDPMPSKRISVLVQCGRTVAGRDVVDIEYRGTTAPDGLAGTGRGYPIKILAASVMPEVQDPELPGFWLQHLRVKTGSITNHRHRIIDLDTGQVIFDEDGPGAIDTPFPYWQGTKIPLYGTRRMRYMIYSGTDIWDYFDFTVKVAGPPPAPKAGAALGLFNTYLYALHLDFAGEKIENI